MLMHGQLEVNKYYLYSESDYGAVVGHGVIVFVLFDFVIKGLWNWMLLLVLERKPRVFFFFDVAGEY